MTRDPEVPPLTLGDLQGEPILKQKGPSSHTQLRLTVAVTLFLVRRARVLPMLWQLSTASPPTPRRAWGLSSNWKVQKQYLPPRGPRILTPATAGQEGELFPSPGWPRVPSPALAVQRRNPNPYQKGLGSHPRLRTPGSKTPAPARKSWGPTLGWVQPAWQTCP